MFFQQFYEASLGHASYLVGDAASADIPALLLSGGALLVGDLARPDLLGGMEPARAAARTFCEMSRQEPKSGQDDGTAGRRGDRPGTRRCAHR